MSYLTNKAAVYFELKNYEACIASCDEAINLKELGSYDYVKLAKAWARKANALAKLQRFEESIAAYDAAMLEHNDNNYKLAQKDVRKVMKKIEDENFVNPELAEVHKNKGNELMTAGKIPEAIQEYCTAVRRNPTNVSLYSNRCAAYIKVMDLSNALKDAQKGLELDPKFVKLYLRLGNVYNLMKQYHKALDAYDQGLKIEPTNAEI
jgi:stress-induced-phosphoprotein 1